MAQISLGTPEFSIRQKLILSGLFLSKFDQLGLRTLGFSNFTEAFNVIVCALGARPASIKNYRDEFDPYFQNNNRKGWHKRHIREYCQDVLDQYGHLDLQDFSGLIGSFFGIKESAIDALPLDRQEAGASAFAQRLITGLAAERYFAGIHGTLPMFEGLAMENTTAFGCGYDFRLRRNLHDSEFLAVEVKGLQGQSGSLIMTPKEYGAESALRDRFFLFIVRNFREAPSHSIFQDPVSSALDFKRTERLITQVSWSTTV